MKKTKELILRAVEKTAQKINIVGNQTLQNVIHIGTEAIIMKRQCQKNVENNKI